MFALVTFPITLWVPKIFLVYPREAETNDVCRRYQAAELTESIRGLDANLAKDGVRMRSAGMWLCKEFTPGFRAKLREQGSASREMISNRQNV